MLLEQIVNRKKVSLENSKGRIPLEVLKEEVGTCPPPLDFKEALREKSGRAIIAEIKRASPSKGLICDEKNPESRGRLYEKSGAAAISILTEEDHFRGSLEDLRRVKESVRIPVLRKDFIIDIYQVYESRVHGADAVLLIVSLLAEKELILLLEISRKLNMCALVEVHTGEELKKALECGADVVGINNRDLNTFKTDIGVSLELSGGIPDSVLLVSESGIRSREDIVRLRQSGVDAFLIGEALMIHPSPGDKIVELLGE